MAREEHLGRGEKAEGKWKNVRAYDSSDLEQWLEQSLLAQAWFANETKVPAEDVRSLDQCWADWANVANPALPGTLFSSAIEEAKRKFEARLEKPPTGPIIIAADSTDEAMAFVAQCLGPLGGEKLERFRYRVLVFDKPGVLPRLAEGARPFIPVIHSREVEAELAPYASQLHSVVVYPRNAVNAEPDIVLEPVSFETFDAALKSAGLGRDDISSLAKQSGRSLTVLRRQLATLQAVRMPRWADQQHAPGHLIPFMLVGAWNTLNETDMAGLSLLSGSRTAEDLERDCQRLVQLDDAPLWSIGAYRGVVSKIDLLFAIARHATRDDLKRFFEVARMVLGEDDPALDLDEDQRWAASIHGKTREFSPAFRQGISETLVLLAVHGGNLFKERLGIDTEAEAASVVRELLTPLTTRKLEANDRDLPLYAEAAPGEFLSIIERDLKGPDPAVFGLLRPVESGVFGSPSRTGLLWALEGLSWNPNTLPQAVFILARLAQVEINDNWANKPGNSLAAVFRAWMPQTAAGHEDRLALVKALFERFPEVAWTICTAQFDNHHQTGDYSHKPLWRPDGYGYGEPFPTWPPVWAFEAAMVELAMTRETYSLKMLCDLIDRLQRLSDEDQGRVWSLVTEWAKSAGDVDKAALREKIRVSTLSRRAAMRAKKSGQPPRGATAAKGIFEMLEPRDLLSKHAWLFRDTWIEESADELEDLENARFEERDRRVRALRVQALREIFQERGIPGLMDVAHRGNISWIVGSLAPETGMQEPELLELVAIAFKDVRAGGATSRSSESLIRGALGAVTDDGKRNEFIRSALSKMGPEDAVQLLVLAPFTEATWSLASALGSDPQDAYWKEVPPNWLNEPPAIAKAASKLAKARRPRASFSICRDQPQALTARAMFELLTDMAKDSDDKPGEYLLEHYYVERAFKYIGSSPELSLEEKAGLEFAYLDVLARSWDRRAESGIPNLETYIESHPEFLVQAIAWTYKRKDGAMDPPEFRVDADKVKTMAERGFKLIKALQRIPGSDASGEIDEKTLAKWAETVRQLCADLSRIEVADIVLGELLSSAPVGKDGAWPCEAVRKVMEAAQSEDMMRGAHTGVYNSRGVRVGGVGGGPERQLADKYRKWAQQIRTSSPFVAAALLSRIAETYEREASSEDTEAKISRRLR